MSGRCWQIISPSFFSSAYCHCTFPACVHKCLCRNPLSYGASLPPCIQVAKAVSHSLNNCVNCLPGQKDVDVALKSIGESSKKLLVDSVSGWGWEGDLGNWAPLRREWSLLPSVGWISEHQPLLSESCFSRQSAFSLFGFLVREVSRWSF